MDNSDPLKPPRNGLAVDLKLVTRRLLLDPRLWGSEAATERSRELSPLYVERFVSPRTEPQLGCHDFWELIFVFRGRGAILGNTEEMDLPLQPNTAVLVPPGVGHREVANEALDTLWVGLHGNRLKGLSRTHMLSVLGVELAPICEQLWLRGRMRQPQVGSELDGLTQTLFARFLRLFSGDSSEAAEGQRLDNAIRFLHQHFAEPINVASLAERFGCSEGHFYRTFKTRTGLTPVHYLTRLRIETAVQLMRNSRQSISKIARLVGYPDPLYFSRVYRKATGQSPTADARAKPVI